MRETLINYYYFNYPHLLVAFGKFRTYNDKLAKKAKFLVRKTRVFITIKSQQMRNDLEKYGIRQQRHIEKH